MPDFLVQVDDYPEDGNHGDGYDPKAWRPATGRDEMSVAHDVATAYALRNQLPKNRTLRVLTATTERWNIHPSNGSPRSCQQFRVEFPAKAQAHAAG